ncbi:MAG: type IIL restriction-modification enzyme MmeI, partial [Angustibacter sp.]
GPVTDEAVREVDGVVVPKISTQLEAIGRVQGLPQRLTENRGIVFQGCITLGMGFVLDPAEAAEWLDEDPRNADVLFPYLNGEDLNSRPDCSPARWVIDFRERTEAAARVYRKPWDRILKTVQPERATKDGQKYPRMVFEWWKFFNARGGMRAAIADLDEVLVIALISKTVMPVRVPVGQVFSNKLGVFSMDSFADQAVLSSSLHQTWAVKYSTTMRTDISYTPTDVFQTLPRPEPTAELAQVGRELDVRRREIMLGRGLGLTKLYNLVNDPDVHADADVTELRELHVRVDLATLAAYGWSDLAPNHGFHTYRQLERWTLSPAARVEVMDRLLAENHRRAALEAAARTQSGGGSTTRPGSANPARKSSTSPISPRKSAKNPRKRPPTTPTEGLF